MRGVQISLITILAFAGCDSLNKPKVDNPVMGPPPPRYSFNNESPEQQGSPLQTADLSGDRPVLEGSQILPASLTQSANNPLSGSQTVAIVNGKPILASEVLEPYGTQLEHAKNKLPPDVYEQARRDLLEKELENHIERKLLVEGLKSMLKTEQIGMLNGFINDAWSKEVARMMRETGVGTRIELDRELRKQHTSLAALKTNFANQRMAMEFLGTKTKSDEKIGRPELIAYYNEHREDYLVHARVKWQQIVVDIQKHGGRAAAQDRLNEIVAKLRPSRGANFSEVAKALSDGPNASNGGRWEWTKEGSLADKRINQALFELPPGQPSQVFESDDALKIVVVDQREDSHYKPFDDLQDEIKETLEKETRKKAARKFIDDMMAQAEITTIFDQSKNRTATQNDIPVRIR